MIQHLTKMSSQIPFTDEKKKRRKKKTKGKKRSTHRVSIHLNPHNHSDGRA